MKTTAVFKETIQTYLVQLAERDELFAAKYAKENKNIDDCIVYILETVHKSGCNGFDDPEIYSMAVHYYTEDDIKVGKLPSNMSIVVNHHVELTDEEIVEARQKAKQRAEDEAYNAMMKSKKKVPKVADNPQQQSLF